MNAHATKAALTLSLFLAALAAPSLTAAAATPAEEARFVAAARKAFDDRKGAGLSELTCWDRVDDAARKGTEKMYADLVEQRDVVWELKLVDADPKAVEKERTAGGPAAPRANLPIVKQLDLTFRDKDGQRILGVIGFAVGEKDGKLMLTTAAAPPAPPAK